MASHSIAGVVASACALSALLTGCGGSEPPGAAPASVVTVTAEPSQTTSITASPAPQVPAAPSLDAKQLANSIAGKLDRVTSVTALTAKTDPNGLLGRPGGYQSAAILTDADGDTSDPEPGVAYGATVEVFSNAGQAARRKAYIRSVLRDTPMLGTEYDYVFGPVLLRVSGDLTPDEAIDYRSSFPK